MERNQYPRRWLALGVIAVALMAVGLDTTVLNLALSRLAGEFGASESELQWFVTSYVLALTAMMLPAGLIGDRYGRRALMLVGLVGFGAGSVACAYSSSSAVFIAARVSMGLAGAALVVMALSMITTMFAEEERPRAIGVWTAANFLSMPLGPIVGGWILTNAWWGWVFLMNVPVIVVGMIAVILFVPESRADVRPRIDWLGVITSSTGLTLVMYGLIEAGDHGWGGPGAMVPFMAGLVVLAGFVGWEVAAMRRSEQPLVDLDLFRSRAFASGVVLGCLGIFALFGIMFVLPQYWQGVLGIDAQGAGFRLLPVILGLVLGAVPADRIVARLGAKAAAGIGFLVLACAMSVGSTMAVSSEDAFVVGWTFAAGLGAGLAFATAGTAALVELDAERSGVGSGLIQVVIKMGPALGASILGSVLTSTYRAAVPVAGLPAEVAEAARASVFGGLAVARQAGLPDLTAAVQAAFVTGMDDALRVVAVVAAAGVVLAFVAMPSRLFATQPDGAQSAHEPATIAS